MWRYYAIENETQLAVGTVFSPVIRLSRIFIIPIVYLPAESVG